MPRNHPRNRNVSVQELHDRIADLGHHAGELVRLQAEVHVATTGDKMNDEAFLDGKRAFARELRAFLGASRECSRYMQQLTMGDNRAWLDLRMADPIFDFHRELDNQGSHDYLVKPGMNQKVRVKSTSFATTPGGPQQVGYVVTGFQGVRFKHRPEDMSDNARRAFERVGSTHGAPFVVDLAVRLYDELKQIAKSGERRGRFTVHDAGNANGAGA